MIIHAYKCPGPFVNGSLCYDIKSCEDSAIPEGWFSNLADAAEHAGTSAMVPEKKKKPEKKTKAQRIKLLAGLPYIDPTKKVVEPIKKVVKPVKEDTIENKKLTDEDKLEILDMKLKGIPVNTIAAQFMVGPRTIYRILKEIEGQ